MIKVKKNVLLLGFAFLFLSAQGNDSLKVNSFNSFRINDFLNAWSETGNFTGIIYNRLENVADLNYKFNQGSGSFHRIMESSDFLSHSISTRSFRKIKNVRIFGSFSYNNVWEKGSRWNGTFDAYRGNPYIAGDSVSSSIYRKEYYSLAGGLAAKLSQNISFAFKVDYAVGVGAKQKDPRPENTVVQFSVNPGIIYHRDKYNLGLDLGYLQRKEEIDYIQTITDNADISYFFFKGFGFYSKEIAMNHFRFQKQNKLFGGIQLETKKLKFPSMTEIRFQYGREGIEDGSSVIYKDKGGDWDILDINLKETIRLGNDQKLHKVQLMADYFSGDGTEYTQQKVYTGKMVQYVTVGKNLKFNRSSITGQLLYDYQKLTSRYQTDWLLHAGITGINNSETYYYMPEVLTADYTNIIGNVSVEKNFYSKSVHLAPALSATYCSNLSQNLNLSDVTEITKTQFKEIYTTDFKYNASDLLKLDAQITCGFFTLKSKEISQFFFNLNYSFLKSITNQTNFSILSGKIGFLF